MDFDVPWEVRWNHEFEEMVNKLKTSGSWDHVRSQIGKIIENPVRIGKYKDGSLKGCRTTHVKEKIIGWEVTPGVQKHMQEEVEEVFFHFIVHHDDMGTGFKQRDPVEPSPEFRVYLDYYAGFDMGSKINDIFQAAKGIDGFQVQDPDWKPEQVIVEGVVPPDSRESLVAVLPDSAEVEYDDPELFE